MWNMKSLQWAELFLTTSHLSSSSWSKLVRDNFAEKLWCCCRGSARLEPGLVWGCRGWSLPQHFLQTIRGVRTEACHRVRIQQLLHNLMKMDVLQGRHTHYGGHSDWHVYHKVQKNTEKGKKNGKRQKHGQLLCLCHWIWCFTSEVKLILLTF